MVGKGATVGNKTYKILAKEKVFDGFVSLHMLSILESDEERERVIQRVIADRGNAVAAVVYNTDTKKFLFVEQFRPGAAEKLLELVAGSMDVDGEPAIDTMKREIEEEIGYQTDFIEPLFEFYSSPGSLTEKMYIFYAEVSKKISSGGGVEDETIQTIEHTFDEIKKLNFFDAKTVAGVQWAMRQAFDGL